MAEKEAKSKKVSFYKLQQGKRASSQFSLRSKLDNIYRNFQNKTYSNVNELEIKDVTYYISAIKKIPLEGFINLGGESEEWYSYAINIANVDSTQEVKYGNLSKVIDEREEIIDLSEEDIDMSQVGPLFDTQLLIDPFYSIVCISRTIGGTNMWALKKFLSRIFGEDGEDVHGIKFAFIPDEKSIDNLENLTLIQSLSFEVAKTGDAESEVDDSRSELGDIKLANKLNGDEYEFRIKSTKLNKAGVMAKIKSLGEDKAFDKVKSINVEGIDNGVEVMYDLLANKLSYSGFIEYDKFKGLTILDNFNYLGKAYAIKGDFITKNLPICEGDSYERQNQ